MASQSKHKQEAQAKRQPLPDFEPDEQEEDYFAAAFEMKELERERAQQQERQQ